MIIDLGWPIKLAAEVNSKGLLQKVPKSLYFVTYLEPVVRSWLLKWLPRKFTSNYVSLVSPTTLSVILAANKVVISSTRRHHASTIVVWPVHDRSMKQRPIATWQLTDSFNLWSIAVSSQPLPPDCRRGSSRFDQSRTQLRRLDPPYRAIRRQLATL